MNTTIANTHEDGIHTVGASNGDADYILWQVSKEEPDSVYFEYYDQINSGYNNVTECTIDMDGLHAVLKDGALVHFYWHPPRHPDLATLVEGLRSIYASIPDILEVHNVP